MNLERNQPTQYSTYSPETNLRLTSDNLYPDPTRSNSTPDRVVPSQLNCVSIVPWELGPLFTSKRAQREPTPWFSLCWDSSVNFHIAWLLSASLQYSPSHLVLHSICNHAEERYASPDCFWYTLPWGRWCTVSFCAKKKKFRRLYNITSK